MCTMCHSTARSKLFCQNCSRCFRCCKCQASNAVIQHDICYHKPHVVVRHRLQQRSRPFVPDDFSLKTGERLTAAADESGKVHFISDHLTAPKINEYPPLWTGTSTVRTHKPVQMNSAIVRKNLKVPMACCKSVINGYSWKTRRPTTALKELKRHILTNVPHERVLIEVCCGADIRFGRNDLKPSNVEVLRITLQEDFSCKNPATGLQPRPNKPKDSPTTSKHATVWFALPCTWGSAARVANSTQGKRGVHTARSGELWDEVESMPPNLIHLIHGTLSMKGDIVFELPKNNYGHQLNLIRRLFSTYGFITVEISGCKLGLKNSYGVPMKKP